MLLRLYHCPHLQDQWVQQGDGGHLSMNWGDKGQEQDNRAYVRTLTLNTPSPPNTG